MVNSETCFRYLGYLMYLVPEVPVGPVVPANLISEILVSPAFQKYSTPMVNSEKLNFGRESANGGGGPFAYSKTCPLKVSVRVFQFYELQFCRLQIAHIFEDFEFVKQLKSKNAASYKDTKCVLNNTHSK